MPSQEPFEKHRKLLLYIAHKVWRRAQAAGAASVQQDDIFGELCVAWCKARDSWDQQHGVPFGPYLMRGMSHHINRWIKYELRQHEMAPFDLDAELSDDEGGRSLHDTLGDESQPSIEDTIITKDMRDYARDPMRWRNRARNEKLLPETVKFLDLMDSPPPALVAIVNGVQARAAYGRNELGIPSTFAPRRITSTLIFDIMGIPPQRRKAVNDQIKRLHQMVSQQ